MPLGESARTPPPAREHVSGPRGSGSVRILAGSASTRAATALATRLGVALVSREVKSFPDGEVYVRLTESVRGDDLVLVQTTLPNDRLVELLLLEEAAHSAGARSVTVAIPYFAYSRQDQLFKEGESVSARALAQLIETNADRVVLVDPHKDHILGFFGVPAGADSATPELAARFRAEGVDLVLAPDKGALPRARQAAELLGVPF
ncbi:MAG: ribose-phosphate diphosphokinase, partial [Thermoplasmatota archaeon]